MARPRKELSKIFHDICDNVYFRSPGDEGMKYPCILYDLSDKLHQHANNKVYIRNDRYTVTVIDLDPDSEVSKKIDELPYTSMIRTYKVDNLNHFVYTLFF